VRNFLRANYDRDRAHAQRPVPSISTRPLRRSRFLAFARDLIFDAVGDTVRSA
jgi:hypothetical protein